MITKRREMPAAERTAAAVAVQRWAIDLVRRIRPATAAAFAPVGTEPGGVDLPQALAAALEPGARLLLPVLRPDNDLDWARYTDPASLVTAARGLRQPAGLPLGVEAVRTAELIFVPALAVDRNGIRLGRGGGSYDRILARAAAAFTVALVYDDELLAAVPAEPHDHPVRAAITPSAGLTLLGARLPSVVSPVALRESAGRDDLP